jgi:GGDEF domain-containing protein
MSLGVALFPEHGADSGSLLRAADAALYQAKQAERDRVAISDVRQMQLPEGPVHYPR